ncbi:hypothetical protein P8452_13461 [Trifolium repens]|nr:hypothetical protein P8452_13461 [Trifolium repens]
MENLGLEFLQFAFRWFNCLLIREIPFQLVTRLWDTYLAEGDALPDFLVYIFASFLLTVSIGKQWKEFLDYNETIGFIFHDDAKKLDRAAKNKYVIYGESCSLFPEEMECYFRDAILYKVEKDYSEEDEEVAQFRVISMCNEVEVVNKFIDEYLSNDENIEPSYSNHQDTHSTVVLGIPSVESTLRETKAQFNSAHGRRHMNSQIFVHCLC